MSWGIDQETLIRGRPRRMPLDHHSMLHGIESCLLDHFLRQVPRRGVVNLLETRAEAGLDSQDRPGWEDRPASSGTH